MKKRKKHSDKKDIFASLGVAALLSFIFRLWILLIPVLFAMLIVAVLMLYQKLKKQGELEESRPNHEATDVRNYCDQVYEAILNQITKHVHNVYPGAKWVWAQSNARRQIENGDDVFILLNRGGGYRRAKVKLVNKQVTEIEYITCSSQTFQKDGPNAIMSRDVSINEPLPENYELLAYEWVEAHVMELNERCNEAIGQGTMELLLTIGELPIPESWPSLCEELKRSGLNDAERVQNGIKIKFLQQ